MAALKSYRFGLPVAAATYAAEIFHDRPFPESETLIEFMTERLHHAFCEGR